MQKQIIILGNGFDVECGLESKYIQFYDEIIKGKYGNNYKDKFWHGLLCHYDNAKNSNDYNWCQIERIIKNTLYGIESNYFSEGRKCIKIEPYMGVSLMPPRHSDRIEKYIVRYCAEFIYVFINNNENTPMETIKTNFYNHLLQELHALERSFCEYLRVKRTEDYTEKANQLFRKILAKGLGSAYSEKEAINLVSDTSVLSFNYTYPLSYINKYRNVHGVVCGNECEDCSHLSLIFGIDDSVIRCDEKLRQSDLRIFSKTYRTLLSAGYWQKEALHPRQTDEKIFIKFLGHSLDMADYSYFQSIFDYYNIYDNALVYLVFYYIPHGGEAENLIRTRKTDDVYKLINYYETTHASQYNGLLHKLILEKRIKIDNLYK